MSKPMPPGRRDEILERDGRCQAHPNGFALDLPCSGRPVIHHIVGRGVGGGHNAANLMALCDGHHRHAHDVDRAQAEACGIIVRST